MSSQGRSRFTWRAPVGNIEAVHTRAKQLQVTASEYLVKVTELEIQEAGLRSLLGQSTDATFREAEDRLRDLRNRSSGQTSKLHENESSKVHEDWQGLVDKIKRIGGGGKEKI